MNQSKRIIFTQGGKGGVGKTELQLSLIPWFQQNGYSPLLLDFDVENTNKSGLQNFFPEAQKHDIHAEGSLDRFFDICDQEEHTVVVADLGSGAGTATYQWFDEIFDEADQLGIRFTSIGVTTNEADAVQSLLKWAHHLQDKVDYLVVLNKMREKENDFEYWHKEPAVTHFIEALSPHIIEMDSRIQELQAEMRNHTTTLQQIIDRDTNHPYFLKTRCLMRAKAYQKNLYDGFDAATDILFP